MKKEKCRFCNKEFTSEKTLSAHLCPKKKRYLDRNIPSCRIGFSVFQTFYKMSTNSKKDKTLQEFIDSKYYISFVKFGRFIEREKPIMPEEYIKYVISNGIKLNRWTNDSVYRKYVLEIIKKEPVETALERTIKFFEKWANDNDTTYNNFFDYASANEIAHYISIGKISPWVLYLSTKCDNVFESFNEDHTKIIKEFINPQEWKNIFIKREDDVEFAKQILEEAGI